MEWLVPILFVLASLAQWWMQRKRQGQEEEQSASPSGRDPRERPTPSRREPQPHEEFGDLGDLLEALGRRRHESPPPPIEHTEPTVSPSTLPPKVSLPKREPAPVLIPEPVTVLEKPKPVPAPIFTAFPEAKIAPISEPTFALPSPETPRVSFRPFPSAQKTETASTHRWAEKLRSPESVRDTVVLSEILAPPVSLR